MRDSLQKMKTEHLQSVRTLKQSLATQAEEIKTRDNKMQTDLVQLQKSNSKLTEQNESLKVQLLETRGLIDKLMEASFSKV